MAIRRDLWLAATATAILLMSSNAGALEPERRQEPASKPPEHEQETGILLDRLTKSQLKIWRSIMEIVLAQDKQGRPLHPRLYGLYQQAATSGHAIFVELSTQSFSYSSLGWCKVESLAEGVQKAAVVMRLNLGMIGRARICEQNRRAGGFIPFAGLRKKERYAEVLGHELTHAVLLLLDADYLGLYRKREAQVYCSSPDRKLIDSLTSLIEGPAEAAEEEIWREVKAGRESPKRRAAGISYFRGGKQRRGEGDGPMEPGVLGFVDHAHPWAATLLDDAAAREGVTDHGESVQRRFTP